MLLKLAALFAVVGTSWAQRPMNTSICDYCMVPPAFTSYNSIVANTTQTPPLSSRTTPPTTNTSF